MNAWKLVGTLRDLSILKFDLGNASRYIEWMSQPLKQDRKHVFFFFYLYK